MKTMTCKQLGGPCDLAHHGNTADEVIKAQDAHLKKVVASGDEAHEGAQGDEGTMEESVVGHVLVSKSQARLLGVARGLSRTSP
jgi:predicted small metal-binding protein